MASFTISVPNEHLPRLVEAFTRIGGYQQEDEDGNPNSVTPIQFTKREIRRMIKNHVIKYEKELARRNITVEDIEIGE